MVVDNCVAIKQSLVVNLEYCKQNPFSDPDGCPLFSERLFLANHGKEDRGNVSRQQKYPTLLLDCRDRAPCQRGREHSADNYRQAH
jgi:hypothetical protein